jgi:hypothetical protein
MACVSAAEQLLDQLPDTPLTRRERQSLSVTAQALASAPQRAGRGRAVLEVVASRRGVKRIALTAQQQAKLTMLPERVAAQVRKLMELGWFDYAKKELLAGRNPGAKGWRHVFCERLLLGGATRGQLQIAFMERLDLKEASAKVQVSLAVAVFAAGGLVREIQGKLRVSAN